MLKLLLPVTFSHLRPLKKHEILLMYKPRIFILKNFFLVELIIIHKLKATQRILVEIED